MIIIHPMYHQCAACGEPLKLSQRYMTAGKHILDAEREFHLQTLMLCDCSYCTLKTVIVQTLEDTVNETWSQYTMTENDFLNDFLRVQVWPTNFFEWVNTMWDTSLWMNPQTPEIARQVAENLGVSLREPHDLFYVWQVDA